MRTSESRPPNRESRPLNGILLLDKPAGLSSNQALQRVRHLFGAVKAGHTGSLDPLATGLLPICFGEATKIAGLLLGSRKAYETECRLGTTTSTDDAEGEPVEQRAVPSLDAATVEAALMPLRGRIVQVPPIYSALKQGGVPLYKRARRGEAVEAPPREVEVFRLDLLERAGDRLRLLVECGSGTYVRSLVRDLGARLGCGAHVTALRRLWVDPFTDPAMHTLESLVVRADVGVDALDACLLPLEQGLAAYPQVRVDAASALRLRQGQVVDLAIVPSPPGRCVALDSTGRAVALAECDAGRLRPLRGFGAPN
jgi:tRNA pseudouridine55 synthase